MNHSMKFLAVAVAAGLNLSSAFAADEHNVVPGLTYAGKPLALHGYDPVSFISLENRIEGNSTFIATHDGVAYYFDSEENKAAFEKSPARYAPQFGGFCAFGVSVAKKFDGDPRYAAIENGKLYVFLNEAVFREFQKDKAGTIAKAESNWSKIQHTAAAEL